jgi:hypothetical protein
MWKVKDSRVKKKGKKSKLRVPGGIQGPAARKADYMGDAKTGPGCSPSMSTITSRGTRPVRETDDVGFKISALIKAWLHIRTLIPA